MSDVIRVLVPDGANYRFSWKVGTMAKGKPFAVVVPESLTEEGIVAAAGDADAILAYKAPITRAVLDAARQARMIQKFGLDCKNIDLAAARERSVPVFTRSLIRNATVADHALALMLACARRLLECHRVVAEARYLESGFVPRQTGQQNVHHGNWIKVPGVGDLLEATIGIVGLGDIGVEIARRVRPFGPRICYYQRRRHAEAIEAALGASYLPLDELVARADYLMLAVPHTPETENLLSRERIARMKPTASVINVGRGGLIDEDALCAALRAGRLAMAGLDVFRWEPLPQTSPLIGLPNVVLSPHMAGGSSERYWEVDVAGALENIRRFFAGEETSGALSAPYATAGRTASVHPD
jgi:phosphoglycerate dehydrogenase-like enzyme